MRLCVLSLVVPLLVPLASEASSLRCGSELVSEGSTRAETVAKCGQPISKDVRTEVDTVKVRERDPSAKVELTQERSVVRTIEEWTYNFGPHTFLQHVTFEDGRLCKVESGKYGF